MEKPFKKNIVISAINVTNAGPFAVLEGCLNYLSKHLAGKYNIIALIHKKSLFKANNISYYEFPKSKRSWLIRLFYEYTHFKSLSKRLKPHLWLSMHDVTPNVNADIRAVYCHHASPFYHLSFREFIIDPVFAFFHFTYQYLYAINIKKNNAVIVQQCCLRKAFKDKFKINNIIVAHPDIKLPQAGFKNEYEKNKIIRFFYPSLPRVFKNFEAACEAAKILADRGRESFELYITIDGTENAYSKHIFSKYKNIKQIKFIGIQPRHKMSEYYKSADCMIFASKLESWGVPITEFKNFKKPILLADLEYARETIGNYGKVRFFPPENPRVLSGLMNDMINGKEIFRQIEADVIEPPFAANWNQLFDLLLNEKAEDIYEEAKR